MSFFGNSRRNSVTETSEERDNVFAFNKSRNWLYHSPNPFRTSWYACERDNYEDRLSLDRYRARRRTPDASPMPAEKALSDKHMARQDQTETSSGSRRKRDSHASPYKDQCLTPPKQSKAVTSLNVQSDTTRVTKNISRPSINDKPVSLGVCKVYFHDGDNPETPPEFFPLRVLSAEKYMLSLAKVKAALSGEDSFAHLASAKDFWVKLHKADSEPVRWKTDFHTGNTLLDWETSEAAHTSNEIHLELFRNLPNIVSSIKPVNT